MRCVLDLSFDRAKLQQNKGFCIYCFLFAATSLQTGSVTVIPVTAPCSAAPVLGFARAQAATAGRTSYGRTRLPRKALVHMTEFLPMVASLRMLGCRTILHTPFLCAVSWMRIIVKTVLGQLCDTGSGYGTLRCYWGYSCPGSATGTVDANGCHPYHTWSSLPSGNTYIIGQLVSGTWSSHRYYAYTYAHSVRCVLDLDFFIKNAK